MTSGWMSWWTKVLGGMLALNLALVGCGTAGVAPSEAFVPAADALTTAGGSSGSSTLPQALLLNFRRVFAQYDRDRDGKIAPGEVEWAPATFKSLDADANGFLTVAEAQPTAERLAQMANLLRRGSRELFAWCDSNQDKYVSLQELNGEPAFAHIRKEPEWSRVTNRVQIGGTPLSYERFEALLADLVGDPEKVFGGPPPRRAADPGKAPVLLVHGYLEPSWYFMIGIYVYLKQKGWPVYTINLFPNTGDIREQAGLVDRKVDEIRKETGAAKVHLVTHSMGGLISRWLVERLAGNARVERLTTIATPHYGTYAALLGIGEGARQMEPDSAFLKDLNKGGLSPGVRYSSIYTVTDEIVIPATSARLDGSNLYPAVLGTGHLTVLFAPHALSYVHDSLTR